MTKIEYKSDLATNQFILNNLNPLVSVIIVNWNGSDWLAKCLNSLRNQTFSNFEIIIVDNASTDDSLQIIESTYPEVKVIQNDANDGFAKGNNIGYRHTSGEYILLLNSDTEASPDLLEDLLDAFDRIPNAASIQAKLTLLDNPNILDSCGSFITITTLLLHFGYKKNSSLALYNEPFPVFSNKGACMMLKRNVIDKIGLFDDEYWCYYEETDLCNRIWLSGWECWYWPNGVCGHSVGGSSLKISNQYIHFHNFKNVLTSYLKNFSLLTNLWAVPLYFFVNILYCIIFILRGKWKNAFAFLRAVFWVLSNIKVIFEKRRLVQSKRRKSDYEIFKNTMKNPRLSYYFYLLTDLSSYSD